MRRSTAAVGLVVVVAGAGAAPASAGSATPTGVTVRGAVATPVTYSRATLAALPQTTVPAPALGSGHAVSGVPVESLVQTAVPTVDPAVKNGLLRVRVTATGAGGRAVTAALGELDPAFGNHPALLVLAVDGHALPQVAFGFPGDPSLLRALVDVRTLDVAVVAAPDPLPAPGGAAVVVDGPRGRVVLSARTLQRLPAQSVQVTYTAGTTVETHAESGPQLALVLLAAGILPGLTTSVTAVGADGYLATVTPAESLSGARTLLLSTAEDGVPLAQPRLIVSGDVKGGRYVSGVVALEVTR